MQAPLEQSRSLPASTSGRAHLFSEKHSECCPALRVPPSRAGSSQRTLLLRLGSLRGQRYAARAQLGSSASGISRQCSDILPCSQKSRRDVLARARSIAGQVGVAAVEEVVEATHAELMSFAALPRHLHSQRDSLVNLQNVESLTDELAQLSQDLERLTTSEAANTSDSPVSTASYHVSVIINQLSGASPLSIPAAGEVTFKGLQQAPHAYESCSTRRQAMHGRYSLLLLIKLPSGNLIVCSHAPAVRYLLTVHGIAFAMAATLRAMAGV